MTSQVGIDISGVQPAQVPGDWLFVVVKTTEGTSVVNPKASAQWAFAGQFPHRGLYHYARPRMGGSVQGAAVQQAKTFCDDALSRGFRPNVDLWQLDCEGMENEAVTNADWLSFVPSFMGYALAQLGSAGFVYVGRYFAQPAFSTLLERYAWWLPDYGPNNGQDHGLPAGVLPVIHQFTSDGGLDKNVVTDPARFASLLKVKVPTVPDKVHPEFQPPAQAISLTRFTHRTLGVCAAQLNSDGGVFCDPPSAYLGGPNQHGPGSLEPYFVGRTPALIREPNGAKELALYGRFGYVVVDTAQEPYHYDNPPK